MEKKKTPKAQQGDTLERFDGLTHHWGVFTGSSVIHKVPKGQSSSKILSGKSLPGEVREDDYETFCAGRKVVAHKSKLPAGEVVTRARAGRSDTSYNLYNNNCEHFATSAAGDRKSAQVDKAKQKTKSFLDYVKEFQNF